MMGYRYLLLVNTETDERTIQVSITSGSVTPTVSPVPEVGMFLY